MNKISTKGWVTRVLVLGIFAVVAIYAAAWMNANDRDNSTTEQTR